jgi:hypothetical protein
MSTLLITLARIGGPSDKNSEINVFLRENPLILGLVFLALGLVLGLWGLHELRQGVAHDKYGNEMRGAFGSFASILRIIAGIGLTIFALYKIFQGLA